MGIKQSKETEEINLPHVKCDSCGDYTISGLHQTRLVVVRKAFNKKVNGQWIRIPPVVKETHVFMCTKCVEAGKPWPGSDPK